MNGLGAKCYRQGKVRKSESMMVPFWVSGSVTGCLWGTSWRPCNGFVDNNKNIKSSHYDMLQMNINNE